MKTQEAYNQYLLYAQAQHEYYETLTWVLFTIFIIAPLCVALIYTAVAIYLNRRGRL